MIRQTRVLSDAWHMRPVHRFAQGEYPRVDAPGWFATSIPSQWQSHPDLARYVGPMVYRTIFAAAEHRTTRTFLRLNGVFYFCRPWLNGADLGLHEGYFTPHTIDVSRFLTAQNELVLEVRCPEEHDKVGKRLITGVFSHWDSLDKTTNPGGVWLPVELIETGPVHLSQVLLATTRVGTDHADVRYRVATDALAATDAVVTWRIAPKNFGGKIHQLESRISVAAGQHEASGMLRIPDPELWWSHDLGHPALYEITATIAIGGVASDSVTFDYGIRMFEFRNWIPYLNGKRFLMKGNNYPPTDTRLATVTRERCATDVQLARECHMNVLRVHAHVAHPALYAEADAQGVLLWQDFPLQWLYARSVLGPALKQVRAMVRLLHNHPSIVVWCMHNEAIYVADTSDERLLSKIRTYVSVFGWNWNRNVLDVALQRVVASEDEQRQSVRSSGEYAVPLLARGTDTHFYYGWYGIYGKLSAWEQIIARFPKNTRFVTEFGAQSFPNHESAVRFMDADVRRLDVARLVERHSFQPDMLATWMDWRRAPDLHALISMTQDYQSDINRFYVDRLRLRKYRPTGGIVPFMFADANPAVSWSIVDYWRVPKASYYALQRAFRPTYACTIVPATAVARSQAIDVPLYVMNDLRTAIAVTVTLTVRDPDGMTLAQVEHQRHVPADAMAMQLDELRLTPTQTGRYHIDITLRDANGVLEQTYPLVVV